MLLFAAYNSVLDAAGTCPDPQSKSSDPTGIEGLSQLQPEHWMDWGEHRGGRWIYSTGGIDWRHVGAGNDKRKRSVDR